GPRGAAQTGLDRADQRPPARPGVRTPGDAVAPARGVRPQPLLHLEDRPRRRPGRGPQPGGGRVGGYRDTPGDEADGPGSRARLHDLPHPDHRHGRLRGLPADRRATGPVNQEPRIDSPNSSNGPWYWMVSPDTRLIR